MRWIEENIVDKVTLVFGVGSAILLRRQGGEVLRSFALATLVFMHVEKAVRSPLRLVLNLLQRVLHRLLPSDRVRKIDLLILVVRSGFISLDVFQVNERGEILLFHFASWLSEVRQCELVRESTVRGMRRLPFMFLCKGVPFVFVGKGTAVVQSVMA